MMILVSLEEQLIPGTLEHKVKEAVRDHRSSNERDSRRYVSDQKRGERRIKRLKQKVDRIEKFLCENEPKIGSSGKEVQSIITDNDSFKLTSSHGVL